MLGEDVQDQDRTVDDLDLELVLEISQLGAGQFTVADHRVGSGGLHHLAHLGDLAASDVGGGVRVLAALDQSVQDLRASGLGEQLQLGHGILCVLLGTRCPDTDQHHALQPELAVLDLGDVLQIGADTRHATQRQPGGKVELVAVPRLGIVALERDEVIEQGGAVIGVEVLLPTGLVGSVGLQLGPGVTEGRVG